MIYDRAFRYNQVAARLTEAGPWVYIPAVDFSAYLQTTGLIGGYRESRGGRVDVFLDTDPDGFPFWESFAEWWANPRWYWSPNRPALSLDLIIEAYLADPANLRYTDCRELEEIPTFFLTADEIAAKNNNHDSITSL